MYKPRTYKPITYNSITEVFQDQLPLSSVVSHTQSISYNSNMVYANQRQQHQNERIDDSYEIQNPLTAEEQRILLKILTREYADSGRKRGAILRYIKHYKTDTEEKTGLKLYRKLKLISI